MLCGRAAWRSSGLGGPDKARPVFFFFFIPFFKCPKMKRRIEVQILEKNMYLCVYIMSFCLLCKCHKSFVLLKCKGSQSACTVF